MSVLPEIEADFDPARWHEDARFGIVAGPHGSFAPHYRIVYLLELLEETQKTAAASEVQALRRVADALQGSGQHHAAAELRGIAASLEAGALNHPRVRVSSTGSWLPERNGDES